MACSTIKHASVVVDVDEEVEQDEPGEQKSGERDLSVPNGLYVVAGRLCHFLQQRKGEKRPGHVGGLVLPRHELDCTRDLSKEDLVARDAESLPLQDVEDLAKLL